MKLQISSLDEFRSHVFHKEEIRESNIGNDCISFCYVVSSENTFDDAWARECRGIVFSKNGHVVGRPLHKFFNVGEREETLARNIDWSNVIRVMDKRDGSMIHSVWTPQGIRLKSKKSFDSDVAKAAETWVKGRPSVLSMISNLMAQNCTAIFEWTSPNARIVLNYPEEELQLLHVRENETGEYLDSQLLRSYASKFGVGCVNEIHEFFDVVPSNSGESVKVFNAQRMLDAAKTREGIEGWVVQFKNGDMVKVKTEWYLKRHKVMTFIRERDIAQMVIDEKVDDLKSILASENVDMAEIISIENRVLHDIRQVALSVDLAYEEDKHLSRKDFAIKNKDHAYFGLLMSKYLGKDINFKMFFEKNLLNQNYSLRTLKLLDNIYDEM